MDKVRVLKHAAFQEVTADLLNSIATTLFGMSDGIAQAFIAGFQNTDHLIFQDLDVTPDGSNLAVSCGLQGVFLYRTDSENSIWGVYKGTRPDKDTPYSEEILPLAAADPTNPRIDILEAEIVEEDDVDYFQTVQMFNPGTETSFAQNQYTKRVRNVKLYIKTGTPSPSPVAPVATSGRFTLREIHVAALATSLIQDDIVPQVFDVEFTDWTTNHGVIIFPAIYDLIQYVKEQLATTRTVVYAKPGMYQLYIPLFRDKVTVDIIGGGGSGSRSAANAGSLLNGVDGEDSYIENVVRANGGFGGRKLLGGDSGYGSVGVEFVSGLHNPGKSVESGDIDGGDGGGPYGGNRQNILLLKQGTNLIKNGSNNILMIMNGVSGSGAVNLNISKRVFQPVYIPSFPNLGESFSTWINFDGVLYIFSSLENMYKCVAGELFFIASGIPASHVIVDPLDNSLMLCVKNGTFSNVSPDGTRTNIVAAGGAIQYFCEDESDRDLYWCIATPNTGIAQWIRSVNTVNQLIDPNIGDVSGSSPLSLNRVTSIRFMRGLPDGSLLFLDQVSDTNCKKKRLVLGDTIYDLGVMANHVGFRGAVYDSELDPVYAYYSSIEGTLANPTTHRGLIGKFDQSLSPSFISSGLAVNIPDQADAILNDKSSGRMGGGGAGAYTKAGNQSGAGGGAGDRVIGTFPVTPGSILNVVVGAGGSAPKNQAFDIDVVSNSGDGGDGYVKISW